MPTDKENVAFLYSILRQLETKHVDWKEVAVRNNITNDHAARMRFHRLRQQQDKIKPTKRGPRKGGAAALKAKQAMYAEEEEEDDDTYMPKKKRKKIDLDVDEDDELEQHRRRKKKMGKMTEIKGDETSKLGFHFRASKPTAGSFGEMKQEQETVKNEPTNEINALTGGVRVKEEEQSSTGGAVVKEEEQKPEHGAVVKTEPVDEDTQANNGFAEGEFAQSIQFCHVNNR